jgi:prolipoprotein diacylglyceryltransferase
MNVAGTRSEGPLNAWLDATIGLTVSVKGHRLGSWTASVSVGAAMGGMLWVLLSSAKALPPALVAAPPLCTAAMVVTAFRRGRSRHRLVWHRYAAVGATMLFGLTWAAEGSVPTAFDLGVVSAAAGLALGRVGCHRVGCCFGVAARNGVWYPWWIDRSRHLPLALMEAFWCVLLLGLGLYLLSIAAPGITALLLVSAYASWRLPAQRLRDSHFRGRVRNRPGRRLRSKVG